MDWSYYSDTRIVTTTYRDAPVLAGSERERGPHWHGADGRGGSTNSVGNWLGSDEGGKWRCGTPGTCTWLSGMGQTVHAMRKKMDIGDSM
jgi:hypothetical protein